MKHAFLAICSLGVVGLAAAAPAGGWYGPPPPGGFGGGLAPPDRMLCNCNNPTTKETIAEPLCKSVGGKSSFDVWTGITSGAKWNMCFMSNQITDVFTDENCQKQFGASYKSFCAPHY